MSTKSKDLTFKARIRHMRGCDEAFYRSMIDYKNTWEKSMFFSPESLVQDQIRAGKMKTREYPVVNGAKYPDITTEPLNDVSRLFKSSIDFELGDSDHFSSVNLGYSKSSSLQDVNRKGYIVNAGGTVTSAKWLPQPLDAYDEEYLYLAVSTIHSEDGLSLLINNPELSQFTKTPLKKVHSAVLIYAYHLLSDLLKLVAVYDLSALGATSNLSWVPIHTTESLGVLAGTFTDGSLHLFKIPVPSAKPTYSRIISPSMTYTLPDSSLTAYDFLTSDKLLVGAVDGNIAEYLLPHAEEYDPRPSYVTKITDSSISIVFCVQVDDSHILVSITSTGPDAIIYECLNPLQNRVVPQGRAAFKPTYNLSLDLILYAGTSDSMTYNFFRNPHETGNYLLRLDAFLTAMKLSERLGHPVCLTGTAGGAVISVNYARKFLNGSKTTNKVVTPLQIWNLEVFKGKLRVSADYTVIPVEFSQQHPVSPHEVMITDLSWNDNVSGSSVYAAGTASGLLIVERLDEEA